jgi:hypothetical protein
MITVLNNYGLRWTKRYWERSASSRSAPLGTVASRHSVTQQKWLESSVLLLFPWRRPRLLAVIVPITYWRWFHSRPQGGDMIAKLVSDEEKIYLCLPEKKTEINSIMNVSHVTTISGNFNTNCFLYYFYNRRKWHLELFYEIWGLHDGGDWGWDFVEYYKKKQNKLHGLSPRANYTDRATPCKVVGACRRFEVIQYLHLHDRSNFYTEDRVAMSL